MSDKKILVSHGKENILFLKLAKEFNSKALTKRLPNLNEVQRKHFENGIYTIVGEEESGDSTIYETNLPEQYNEFIRWMIRNKI